MSNNKKRPYRLIHGVAYPPLKAGKNDTQIIRSKLSDRHALYRDDAMRLSEHDLERLNGLRGKPICVENDRDLVVGEIIHTYKDSEGKMRMDAKIFTDTPIGEAAWQNISSGRLRGLSVGYDAEIAQSDFGSYHVNDKSFHDISLCNEPYFPGS